MPKRTAKLTQFEKGRIIGLYEAKKSKHEIAKKLGRDSKTIRCFIRNYEANGSVERKSGSGLKNKPNYST